jgi:hypothetical protein
VIVELTDAGRRSLADHRVFGDSSLALAAREMPPAERRELIDSLTHLIERARARTERSNG